MPASPSDAARETPFEEFGAPWINGEEVASALNARHLPGLHFTAQPFIPVVGLYSGQRCGGVAVRITDRQAVRAMRMGIEIAAILKKLYPADFDPAKLLLLAGNATPSASSKTASPQTSWSPAGPATSPPTTPSAANTSSTSS